MLKELRPVAREFDRSEEQDETIEDAPIVELHSGYRVYTSRRPNRLPYAETEATQTFRELVEEWREDTRFTSSLTDIVLHPAYQRIIGMGPGVVPLILRELQREPAHWFWALRALTGADPVDPKDAGRVRKMAEAWLTWGKRQGYL